MGFDLASAVPEKGFDLASAKPAAESSKAVTGPDRALAGVAGFNSMLASIAGIPADTLMNLADLGKAAMGFAYGHVTGKSVPSALEVGDRARVPFTADWFKNDIGPNGERQLRPAYRLEHPEDAASRYIAAAGSAVPATMMGNPATAGEAAMGLVSNLSGNLAGQGMADLTENADPTTRTLATASAQMLGSAIPGVISSRIAQPMQANLTAGQHETIATADANDIPIDAAQRTGSTFLRRMRNLASDNPFTAGGQKEFSDEQKTAINRALLRTIGEDAPRATPEVMGRANDRIGHVMDGIAQRNPAQFDVNLAADIHQVQQALVRTVPESMRGPIETNINDIFEAAQQNNGVIPGAVYRRTRSALQTLGQDPKVSTVANDLREALDDALTRSIANPNDGPALQGARLQWRNMRTIESAISKDNEGNISPARVANTLGTKGMGNRNRSVYGRGDQELPELARAAKSILDQDPNSGTPLRLASQSGPAMIGGAVMAALTGHIAPAVGLATLGYGLPRGMQALNNSEALGRYLANGITPGPLRNSLTSLRSPDFLGVSVLNSQLNADEDRLRGLLAPEAQ